MRTLIIFAKLPVEGQVKTRLAATSGLSHPQVTRLYEAFLQDTITAAAMTGAERIAIHYWPGDESGEKGMKRIVRRLSLGARNERKFAYVPQGGDTFTDRVKHAFAVEEEQKAEEILMIGADAPLIKPEAIDAAFDFVYARSGMALAPSGEGGVALIGYTAEKPPTFDDVFTHGAELLNLTAEARRLGVPLTVLPALLDIDVAADLVTLVSTLGAFEYQKGFETQVLPMHTINVVAEMELTVERSGDESRSKRIVTPTPA